MSRMQEIRQLLTELKTADNEAASRRIRRELRKRGHFVSKSGRIAVGIVATRRRSHNGNREHAAGDVGDSTRQSPSVTTTLRLAGDVHRRLQLLAADEGKSANAIIEDLLRRHLDELGIPSHLKRET